MLAIIIPYYKITFFEGTLQSLVIQTDKRFKVYIGNDGSPENPSDLLQKYKGKFDFEYHCFQSNFGGVSLVKQWDRCVALSGAEEWLMILGDDDFLGENVVEEFYRNLPEVENESINLIKFSTQSIDKVKNSISKVFKNPQFENAADFYYRRHLGLVRSSLSEHIFRRESYLRYSFKNYPLAWHSDDYAWIEFSENKPIFAINEAIVSITVSNESLTGTTDNLAEKNLAELHFYMDLIKNYLNLFNEEARIQFLEQAEVSVKKTRKLTLREWNFLFFNYVNNYSTISFLKFTRRFLRSFKQ